MLAGVRRGVALLRGCVGPLRTHVRGIGDASGEVDQLRADALRTVAGDVQHVRESHEEIRAVIAGAARGAGVQPGITGDLPIADLFPGFANDVANGATG